VAFRRTRAELDDGPNFEARARAVRHDLLGPDALTGHTADDQAETVLLALLRGSGATGLSAMRPDGRHPLLGLRRRETRQLCAALQLDPVEDPTNTDPRFRRNRIRHELLPLIDSVAERDVVPLLVRSADLLGDDDRLLDELAGAIDPTDARALSAAPLPLARRAIRAWLSVGGYPPDAAAVARVLDVATGIRAACEVAGVGRIRRSHQRLSIEPVRSYPPRFPSTHPTG
jgi:tRNA(Ile)-lysidine synthase